MSVDKRFILVAICIYRQMSAERQLDAVSTQLVTNIAMDDSVEKKKAAR
jgi:hypothetical protein